MLSLDDSAVCNTVIESAISRPWEDGTEFLCLTAIPTLTQYFYDIQDSHEIESLEIQRNQKVQANHHRLQGIADSIKTKLPKCKVSFDVIGGDPREVIVEKAKEWGARLIIVGSRGKNWMDRILIGSVSEAIATWSECSVEVVK